MTRCCAGLRRGTYCVRVVHDCRYQRDPLSLLLRNLGDRRLYMQVIATHTGPNARAQISNQEVHAFLLTEEFQHTTTAMLCHELIGGAEYPPPSRCNAASRAEVHKYAKFLKGSRSARLMQRVRPRTPAISSNCNPSTPLDQHDCHSHTYKPLSNKPYS